jgi:hypothetical protein
LARIHPGIESWRLALIAEGRTDAEGPKKVRDFSIMIRKQIEVIAILDPMRQETAEWLYCCCREGRESEMVLYDSRVPSVPSALSREFWPSSTLMIALR